MVACMGFVCLLLTLVVGCLTAAEIHVRADAPTGGDGSAASPFARLSEAAKRLQPGDRCLVHAGVYRETLRLARSGTAEQPIIIDAAGDGAVVLSGCDPVTGWQRREDGVWAAPVAMTMDWQQQVFVDGRMLWLARWPDAPQGALLDFPTATLAKGSKRGLLVAPELPPGDLTGAQVWVSSYKRWYCWTAPVEKRHGDRLLVSDTTDAAGKHVPKEGGRFVIIGAASLFDAPWEWWHDGTSLLLRLNEDHGTPGTVAVKRRRVAIDLTGRSHIRVAGLGIHAATIVTDAASKHCEFDRIQARYVSHSWLAHQEYASQRADTGIELKGVGHRLRDSTIAFSCGNGVVVGGDDMHIFNCHIHDTDYVGTYASAIELNYQHAPDGERRLPSRRSVISHCTLARSGRSLIGTGGFYDSLIQFCELRHAGLLTWDLGMIYGNGTAGGGSEFRYNHLHHNLAGKRNMGLYHDHGCQNILNHHNVVWGTDYAALKNNQYAMYLFWYHNTARCGGGKRGQAYGSAWNAAQPRQLWGCELRANYLQGAIEVKANAGELLQADNLQVEAIPPDDGGIPAPSGRMLEEPIPGLVGPVDLPAIGARHPQRPWRVGHDFAKPPTVDLARSCFPARNRLRDAAFEGGEWEAWKWQDGAAVHYVGGARNQWVIDAEARMGQYAARLPAAGASVAQTVTDLPAGRAWTAIVHCDVRSGATAVAEIRDAAGAVLASADCTPRRQRREGDHAFQAVVLHATVPETSATLVVRHGGGGGPIHVDDTGFALQRTGH